MTLDLKNLTPEMKSAILFGMWLVLSEKMGKKSKERMRKVIENHLDVAFDYVVEGGVASPIKLFKLAAEFDKAVDEENSTESE